MLRENNHRIRNDREILFVTDSGATERIVSKRISLSGFVKSKSKLIRCSNKNQSANIEIDVTGNIDLRTVHGRNLRL